MTTDRDDVFRIVWIGPVKSRLLATKALIRDTFREPSGLRDFLADWWSDIR